MTKDYLFTSESVSPAHPDKLCDAISDAILDAYLNVDPDSRVACETFAKTGFIVVGGEVRSKAQIDVEHIVRKTIKEVGYDDPKYGFDGETCGVLIALSPQSPDIAQGVDSDEASEKEIGAGDQGMMFGYATNETDDFMPMPISFAHKLMRKHAIVRKQGLVPFLRPDAKAQVTIEYKGGKASRIHTVVLSTQHDPDVTQEQVRKAVKEHIIEPVCENWVDSETIYHINPTGKFVIGGPVGDAGLTGRKIIVDTYGGMGRHGGGAFSGKDSTKVDRSGAYVTRYIAKNIVAAGLADRCEVQVAYAIGKSEPVSLLVDTFGTGTIPESQIAKLVRQHFPLTPGKIIKELGLNKPIFRDTASFGHFGRDHFPWERLDKVPLLKQAK